MIDFLAGVPGKLKTLTDRLTATWAAKLDTLAADYTTARATKLDNLSVNVNTLATASNLALTAKEDTPLLDTPIANGIATPVSFGLTAYNYYNAVMLGDWSTTTSTTFDDLANGTYTGKGVLKGVAFMVASDSGGSRTGTLEIIIDGVTALSFTLSPPASSTYGVAAVGSFFVHPTNTVYLAVADDAIPFKTSIQVRYKISNVAGTAYAAAKILKTG